MYRTTLTSGTSYTVPAGVTYLNVTLVGGGGGSGATGGVAGSAGGTTTFTGATSAAGGARGAGPNDGSGNNAPGFGLAGSPTYTAAGAGSAVSGTNGVTISSTLSATAGATIAYAIGAGGAGAASNGYGAGGAGGAGCIFVEYWV
jgi:hypothetical protein